MKRIVIVLVISLFYISAWGQSQAIKEFPVTDTKLFGQKLKEFMANSKNEAAIKTSDEFFLVWDKGLFTASEMSTIAFHSQKMLEAKMRAQQDFELYLQVLMAYKQAGLSEDKLKNFHDVLLLVLSKVKKDYKDYGTTVLSLFSRNNIFETTVKSWNVSSKEFTIKFEKEAIIYFQKTDIFHYTKGDTISIYNTQGTFYTDAKRWIGNGGEVYWERVGIPKTDAKARLTKYRFDVRGSEYFADSVSLTYPKALKEVVLGKFSDKVTTTYKGKNSDYPRFTSYKNVFTLNNVFNNIDFVGGFTLEGNGVKGTGSEKEKATIIIRRGGKTQLRATAKSFNIESTKISSSRASVTIYLGGGKDSLHHSQAYFNYQEKDRKLTISRREEGVYASPFSDSYHQVDFIADNIFWNIDESKMQIRSISHTAKEVSFESNNFYNEHKVVQTQGTLNYNPIVRHARFFAAEGNSATLKEVADNLGNLPQFVDEMFFELARDGFVFYDVEGQVITAKKKLIHYDNAYSKNYDYDVIKWGSLIKNIIDSTDKEGTENFVKNRPNAELDLNNYDMKMEGVSSIKYSDSQQTYIFPKRGIVTLKKNRDMVFDGQVNSGRFSFFGKGFYFNYDSFKVEMTGVDSLKFKFPEYNEKGKVIRMREIQNTIQNVTGTLEIDQPDNKSGRVRYEDYPIFTCKKKSYVYYDKINDNKKDSLKLRGVYKKETFYFEVDPFVQKRLDDFTADGFKLPGSFYSADIIPVIKEKLNIDSVDFSLGFENESPKEGYPLYKGKGKGVGTFKLSNGGFRGKPVEVDYLVSKMKSNLAYFFPDSMLSNPSESFEIAEATAGKYPPLLGNNVRNRWKPYLDSMFIYKTLKGAPISVYNGKINFTGYFVLTPEELLGSGTTKYQAIVLESKATSFFADRVKVKTGNLELVTPESKKSALSAKDVSADLDLTKDYADFQTNSDTSKVQLPSNMYATTLNKFSYDVKKNEVNLVKPAQQKMEDAYFVSNREDQEQFNFNASSATYNLKNLVIQAKDVPYLLVGDAEVRTPNKELQIKKDGEIGSIQGAEITCSNENRFHKINNAFVQIFSKKRLNGYGYYDYIDKSNTKYTIYFKDVHTDEVDGETIANGEIKDSSKFFLAPEIKFQGKVTLYSTVKDLYFDGFIKPQHQFEKLGTQYVKMQDTIDPKEVLFDLRNPMGMDEKELYTGIFYSPDSQNTYSLFYGRKKNIKDYPVYSLNGYMVYDEKTNSFVVKDYSQIFPEKGEDPLVQQNYTVTINKKSNSFDCEGPFDMVATNFKLLTYQVAGKYSYEFDKNIGTYDVAMAVEFPMNDDALKLFQDSMLYGSSTGKEYKISGGHIINGFNHIIKDKKDRGKIAVELNSYEYYNSPEFIKKTVVFSGLKMEYIDSLKAFVSVGEIGLGSIKKIPYNKVIFGAVKIKPGKKMDAFSMILESSKDGGYHYFSQKGNDFRYLSSDMSFVDKVTQTAAKVSKPGFKLVLGTTDDAYVLKNRMLEQEDLSFLDQKKQEEEDKKFKELEEAEKKKQMEQDKGLEGEESEEDTSKKSKKKDKKKDKKSEEESGEPETPKEEQPKQEIEKKDTPAEINPDETPQEEPKKKKKEKKKKKKEEEPTEQPTEEN